MLGGWRLLFVAFCYLVLFGLRVLCFDDFAWFGMLGWGELVSFDLIWTVWYCLLYLVFVVCFVLRLYVLL